MAKYIDTDKLTSEIKGKIAELESEPAPVDRETILLQMCRINAFREVLAVITRLEKNSLQQEHPEEICSKCIHHGKDDCCYNPHGGMRSLINENGVYECTGFYEQEQPEVDLEKVIEFNCIGRKVKMTIQELISYYIDTECVNTAIECGF